MSTFIQLATSLRTECGVTGTDNTVTGATGEWGRLVNWVATAWEEIQLQNPDFDWMRRNVSFSTVAEQGEYTTTDIGITDLGYWREKSFRIYLQSAGEGTEQLLHFKEYNAFRDYYLLSTRKTTYARPTEVTVTPAKTVMLGLKPNDIYVVSGEYFITPTRMTLDSDEPAMPARYHQAIVYKAMMYYAAYEAAPEIYAQGKDQFNYIMNRIRRDQLPEITRGKSLI